MVYNIPTPIAIKINGVLVTDRIIEPIEKITANKFKMINFFSLIKKQNKHNLPNGILYLKGGDLTEELKDFPRATEFNIADFFKDEFFETKKVVHLPLKFKA